MEISLPTIAGITKHRVVTERLTMNVLEREASKTKDGGPEDGAVVLFVHGNLSSATFWEETMISLPPNFRPIACDLRGYGETEALPIDATLGLTDMVADLRSLVERMGLGPFHLVGHSMGGALVMKYAAAYPTDLRSLTLVAPVSPFGYAGTRDRDGTPCNVDGAPAGAAGANPDFVRLLKEGYTGVEEQFAPRNVLRQFYIKPPFVPEREEALLTSMLATRIGDDWYPGDSVPSENWPGAAPGKKGVLNAIAGRYFNAAALADIDPKPPIFWIRGADDLIISNNAMFEIAALGAMGAVPGWPGNEACPAQPMIDQTESVLERYEKNGGSVRRHVIADSGHTPFVDQARRFNAQLASFLQA